MAYTEYFQFTSGLILYGKARPYNATWATGVVSMAENGSTGEYSSASFVDGTQYGIFIQAGGSPASSDTPIGTIYPSMAGTGLTAEQAANLDKLVNAVIGKKVVTPVGDGRFDIAVRNAADSATLVTIRHNPVTGDTTIL